MKTNNRKEVMEDRICSNMETSTVLEVGYAVYWFIYDYDYIFSKLFNLFIMGDLSVYQKPAVVARAVRWVWIVLDFVYIKICRPTTDWQNATLRTLTSVC